MCKPVCKLLHLFYDEASDHGDARLESDCITYVFGHINDTTIFLYWYVPHQLVEHCILKVTRLYYSVYMCICFPFTCICNDIYT